MIIRFVSALLGKSVDVSNINPMPVASAPIGQGALTAVPGGSTNGTAIGTPPANTQGVRLYLPAGSSVTYTISLTAPVAAPSTVVTIANTTHGPTYDENLSASMIYITAISGSPLFRWM